MAIQKFFKSILNDQEITIFGDREQLKDFTYISDIFDEAIMVVEISGAIGENLNLGCSNPISVSKLVDRIYDIANKPKKVRYIKKQLGDVDITYLNVDKAKKFLYIRRKLILLKD